MRIAFGPRPKHIPQAVQSTVQPATDGADFPSPASFATAESIATEPSASNVQSLTSTTPRQTRLRRWVEHLYRNPNAEAESVDERRARLLEELTQAVADAPDDMPIREVISKLNRHADD